MGLKTIYTDEFERIWRAYPAWPKGRSIKIDSYSVFLRLKRELDFSVDDIDGIIAAIEKQKRERVTWQKGDKYGPQSLQRWLRIRGWDEEAAPYETVRDKRKKRPAAYQEFTPAPAAERTVNPDRLEELKALRKKLGPTRK